MRSVVEQHYVAGGSLARSGYAVRGGTALCRRRLTQTFHRSGFR
jgi:hypothetical protein